MMPRWSILRKIAKMLADGSVPSAVLTAIYDGVTEPPDYN